MQQSEAVVGSPQKKAFTFSDKLACSLWLITLLLTVPLTIAGNRLDKLIDADSLDKVRPFIRWLPIMATVVFAGWWCSVRLRKYKVLKAREADLQRQVVDLSAEKEQLALSLPKDWEGIESTGLVGYVPKLAESEYHPQNCLSVIESHLDFMGHGASKWTSNEELLEGMLARTKAQGGRVRFLLLKPTAEPNAPAQTRKIARSLMTLKLLMPEFTHLEVKVYEHAPQFRLTFIDNDRLIVGHYNGYERDDSIDTPLQVYSKKPDWSFSRAYEAHFISEWNSGQLPNWDKVMEIVERNQ